MHNRIPKHHPPQLLIARRLRLDPALTVPQHDQPARVTQRPLGDLPDPILRPHDRCALRALRFWAFAGFEEGEGDGAAGGVGGGGRVEAEEGADVGFVGAGDGVAFVDERQEEGFFVAGGGGFGQGEKGDGGGAEGEAVDSFEAAG